MVSDCLFGSYGIKCNMMGCGPQLAVWRALPTSTDAVLGLLGFGLPLSLSRPVSPNHSLSGDQIAKLLVLLDLLGTQVSSVSLCP